MTLNAGFSKVTREFLIKMEHLYMELPHDLEWLQRHLVELIGVSRGGAGPFPGPPFSSVKPDLTVGLQY